MLTGVWNTPIYNAIKEYLKTNPAVFHMPGQKLGRGMPAEFLKSLESLDLTEIPGTDNLHYPSGPIKEAEELASKAFGSERTFFLVNGSTCGIHAMIMTVCKPGGKLIVGRDCHRSVIGGLMLAGARPVYIKPEFNSDFGISTVILPSEIEKALKMNPDAEGVLITRPSYYGVCSDIRRIAEVVHSYGKVLIVDEAHGAHLKFSSSLPVSAMEAGADICVQSAHKTLAAFTQGAYLHVKSAAVDIDRLKFNLSLLQTSSPSYIIMASLDIAREIMQREGMERLEKLLDTIERFKSNFGKGSLPFGFLDHVDGGELDKTRLVINVSRFGLTGFETDKILREKYSVQVEMSDLGNIVCIATAANSPEDFDRLYSALKGISDRYGGIDPLKLPQPASFELPEQRIDPAEAMRCRGVKMRLDAATGRISRGVIVPYPPGIPAVCPGEIITGETVEYIYNIISSGGVVNGVGEGLEIDVVE